MITGRLCQLGNSKKNWMYKTLILTLVVLEKCRYFSLNILQKVMSIDPRKIEGTYYGQRSELRLQLTTSNYQTWWLLHYGIRMFFISRCTLVNKNYHECNSLCVKVLDGKRSAWGKKEMQLMWILQQDVTPKITNKMAKKKWFSEKLINMMEWPNYSKNLPEVLSFWLSNFEVLFLLINRHCLTF